MMAFEIFDRNVAGSQDFGRRGRKAEAGQLFKVERRRMRSVVREKQDVPTARAQMLDKTDGIGENTAAEVDRAVHIENIKFFGFEDGKIGILEVHLSGLRFR